jgi:hypothetical protein
LCRSQLVIVIPMEHSFHAPSILKSHIHSKNKGEHSVTQRMTPDYGKLV